MRVCLVNQKYADSKPAYIPLGLGYIAAVLRNSKRHQVKVIDALALNLSDEEIEKQLKDFGAEIVGVSAVTELLEEALNICKLAKRNNMVSVLGGPHATLLPEETLAFDEVDIICIGGGEYTLLDLCDVFEKGGDIKNVKGIMFKKGKKQIITEPREQIKNLDELPFPARDLFPWKLYPSYSSIVRKLPCMHIMSSRGCPFHCTFCSSQSLWKCSKSRSPKNIVDEIEHLIQEYKVKEIYIMDDTFNSNLKRCEEICEEIIKRKIKISLRVQARVAPITMKLLKLMKKAGVWVIYYGVESGNQEVLNNIRKGVTIKQIRDAFRMTKEVGIRTFGFFMIGLPKDTKKTIQDTLNLVLELNPDIANFTILAPYPGTEVYELAIREKSIKRIKPKEIFKIPRYTNKNVSDDELKKELSRIYKKFYMRPRYMIKRLLSIRTLTELKVNIISGLPFLNGENPFIVAKKWIAPK